MMHTTIQELPQGLRTAFEVISQQGTTGRKTWVLRDLQSQIEYQLSPATIQGWDIQAIGPVHAGGPSIIVVLEPGEMVAMHLPSGEFYRDAPPPSRLQLKKERR
ncbi:TPA: hypothetical protein I8303_004761 [Aeromonas hydrophila]|jgi:hypothetical protein|uniref:DUF5440 family protein n=1 Tax=Aeromonas hydrophila TaxID=644 RepID=UPI001A32B1D5|nr:hypothetical protein [Aeromonas hydrophila]HAT3533963.1 hypothetical protein [Aeromonas hydrophila]